MNTIRDPSSGYCLCSYVSVFENVRGVSSGMLLAVCVWLFCMIISRSLAAATRARTGSLTPSSAGKGFTGVGLCAGKKGLYPGYLWVFCVCVSVGF